MHFKNFTLCEFCFDRPALESGGNMASQWAILTFQAEEEIILEPLDLLVIRGSVYGGLLNSPCLTRFAWIELRVERLCKGDDCWQKAALQMWDSVQRSVWARELTIITSDLMMATVQYHGFYSEMKKLKVTQENLNKK